MFAILFEVDIAFFVLYSIIDWFFSKNFSQCFLFEFLLLMLDHFVMLMKDRHWFSYSTLSVV